MKKFLVAAILIYQKAVSPWLGRHCRFYPSCSEFARQALEAHGATRGTGLTLRRLLSCHPFHPGGYQPVQNCG